MSLKSLLGIQTEEKVLNLAHDYMSQVQEINCELNNICVRKLMSGGKLSWHVVRRYVNSNFQADLICKQANLQGIPIVYNGKVFENWETI